MQRIDKYYSGKRVEWKENELFLGNYNVIADLGEGTYGKVRLAVDIFSNTRVALKFIKKSQLTKPGQIERVRAEAKLMSIIQHPNLCKLYSAIENREYIVLEMEYIQGEELFDYITRNKKLNESESRNIFIQLLQGVTYLHNNRIIHRDLKPENIIIDNRGGVKIIDFGFATTFRTDAFCTTHCGSPYYAAPEMVSAREYVGPEVDIWSLGIILYAMTHGKLPFDGKDVKELYNKILSGYFVVDEKLSYPLRHLINKMIHLDPRSRICMFEIQLHKWVNFVIRESEVFYEVDISKSEIVKKLLDFHFDIRTMDKNLKNVYSAESCFFRMIERKIDDGVPLEKIANICSEREYISELSMLKNRRARNEVFLKKINSEEESHDGSMISVKNSDTPSCCYLFKETTNRKKLNVQNSTINKKNNESIYITKILKEEIKIVEEKICAYLYRKNYKTIKLGNKFQVLIERKNNVVIDIIIDELGPKITIAKTFLVIGNHDTYQSVANMILNFK